jgi:TonB family protein
MQRSIVSGSGAATAVLMACLAWPAAAAAQEVQPELAEGAVPLLEDQTDREAMVVLRLTVRPDGTTDAVQVIDGFYTQELADAVIAAVQDWRFDPGTVDGEPVEWILHDFAIQFPLTDGQPAVTDEFREAFGEVSDLIQADRHAEAEQRLLTMQRDQARLLFEYAFINDNLFNVYVGMNRPHAALAAIRTATYGGDVDVEGASDGSMLPPDMLAEGLRKRFLIEASLGFNADAMQTWGRLQRFDIAASVAEQADAVRRLLDSEDPVSAHGAIDGTSWVYGTARRTFTLVDVEGELTHIDAQCTRRYARLPFQSDVEWSLPAGWGDCALAFGGEPGTSFTVVEFVD